MHRMGASKMAGKKSATLIFVMPIRLVPIIMIKIEPAQVISLMAPALMTGATNSASSTKPPCMTKTDTAAKSTPYIQLPNIAVGRGFTPTENYATITPRKRGRFMVKILFVCHGKI